MKNEIILQSLIDSFEVLKDSWERNKESIIDCIVKTESYDGNVAMDMWLYILNSNSTLLKTKEGVEGLIHDVFYKFRIKYEQFVGDRYDVRVMLYHVIPYMIKKEELIKVIFGESYNAGVCDEYDEYTPACIAAFFLFNNPQTVAFLLDQITNNNYLVEVSIGELTRKSCNYVKSVYDNIDNFKKKYKVSNQVKDVILNYIGSIKDKEDRAKCTIAFLSL